MQKKIDTKQQCTSPNSSKYVRYIVWHKSWPNEIKNRSFDTTTRSLSRKRALRNRVERRCTMKRKIQTPAANWKRALEVRSDPSKTRGNCRPKRTAKQIACLYWVFNKASMCVDQNGSGGVALVSALPYGALTPSIIKLPSVIGKALTEEKISFGPA